MASVHSLVVLSSPVISSVVCSSPSPTLLHLSQSLLISPYFHYRVHSNSIFLTEFIISLSSHVFTVARIVVRVAFIIQFLCRFFCSVCCSVPQSSIHSLSVMMSSFSLSSSPSFVSRASMHTIGAHSLCSFFVPFFYNIPHKRCTRFRSPYSLKNQTGALVINRNKHTCFAHQKLKSA